MIKDILDTLIPWTITAMIVAGFTMYMDVQRLKEVAKDYRERADKAHARYETEIRANREALIRIDGR